MALLEGWASAPVSIPLPARASAPIARSAMTPNVKSPTLPRPPDNPLITHPLLLPKTRAIYVPYPTSPSTSLTARQTLTPQHMNRKNLNKFVAHCSKSDGPTANRTVGYERSTKTTSYSSPLLASCGSVPPTRPLVAEVPLRPGTWMLDLSRRVSRRGRKRSGPGRRRRTSRSSSLFRSELGPCVLGATRPLRRPGSSILRRSRLRGRQRPQGSERRRSPRR